MPLNIAPPKKSTQPLVRKAGRGATDRGPNLFLDNKWLEQSYTDGETYDVPCEGHWETSVVKKGPNKGQPIDRLVGEAAEVTRQLREAAETLGIGVAIKYYPVERGGKEVANKVLIKYVGIKRKQRRETAPVESAPAE